MTLSGLLSGTAKTPQLSGKRLSHLKKIHRGCWLNSLIRHGLSTPPSRLRWGRADCPRGGMAGTPLPCQPLACSSLIPVPRGEPVLVGCTPGPPSCADSGSGGADGCYCTCN